MGIHVVFYYDEPDAQELADVDWQCSARCMFDTIERECDGLTGLDFAGTINIPGPVIGQTCSVSWGGYPCGTETNYNVYCSGCGTLLWKATQ